MKNLTLAALAAFVLVAVAPAQGQTMHQGHETNGKAHMQHGNMAHGMKMGQLTCQQCCMTGLSTAEQKSAAGIMKGWSADEKAAWDRRCSVCMADPHTALAKVNPKDVTPAMVHQHMMSGLNPAEQKSMTKIMADKKNSGLLMKMVENCCTYGMKHAPRAAKS